MVNSTYIIEQNNNNKTASSIYARIVFTALACIMTSVIVSTITIYLVMTFVSRKASDLANMKILSFLDRQPSVPQSSIPQHSAYSRFWVVSVGHTRQNNKPFLFPVNKASLTKLLQQNFYNISIL